MKQPGLDQRHRDQNGEISRKHGNTLVGTLRRTHGSDFEGDSDVSQNERQLPTGRSR